METNKEYRNRDADADRVREHLAQSTHLTNASELRSKVRVTPGEELMFGDLAPVVRRLADATLALRDAREVVRRHLNESRSIDEMRPVEERKPVVERADVGLEGAARDVWVQLGNGTTSDIVSEHTAFLAELFERAWFLEDAVEKAHRGIGIDLSRRHDAEQASYASKPTAEGRVEIEA